MKKRFQIHSTHECHFLLNLTLKFIINSNSLYSGYLCEFKVLKISYTEQKCLIFQNAVITVLCGITKGHILKSYFGNLSSEAYCPQNFRDIIHGNS